MRNVIALTAGALAIAAVTPAIAQQRDASVNSYLCEFAGKCDAAASPDEKADAATPSGVQPRSSETRGFHLAGGTPVAAPAAASAAPAPARRTPMAARRPSQPPGAGKRMNLLLAFEYNSDQMTPTAQAKAKVFAEALMTPELKDKRFLIEGHTDARGSRGLNIDLSRRRAQSVADFLIAQGVSARNVDVRGVGSTDPLPGQSANAEANRRVEAVLLS